MYTYTYTYSYRLRSLRAVCRKEIIRFLPRYPKYDENVSFQGLLKFAPT